MRLFLLLCGVIWSGCTCTLPESVPMKVSLKLEVSPTTASVVRDRAMHERFVGAEVVSNGKVLTTLELDHMMLEGTYTATRAEAVGSQKASYALRVKGTCGVQELPLSPPPAHWQAMDEKALADVFKSGHEVPVFLGLAAGTSVPLFIDAGDEPQGKVTIAEAEFAPDKPSEGAGRDLWLSGCKLPLEVKVDGEVIGKIEGNEPVVFISAKTDQCHEMGAVLYGNESKPPFNRFVTRGRGVFSLPMKPSYFLEFAPSSVKSSGKGTWDTQLVRTTDCSSAP